MSLVKAPPFKLTPEEVVVKILARGLSGKDGHVYTISDWGSSKNDASDLDGDSMRLRGEHAKPLIDAGLMYRTTSGSIYYGLTPAGIRLALASPLMGYKPLDVEAMLRHVLGTVLFGPHPALSGMSGGDVAIPAIYAPGGSKLVLVLGENAAGKSLFRRVMNGATHKGKAARYEGDSEAIRRGSFPVSEFMGLSMQGRTSSGFMSSVVYGEESYHSTGENSAHTLLTGIKTAGGREHTTILYMDEPDIGASASVSAGMGVALREWLVSSEAPLVQAVFVTSHSPALVAQLASLNPHYVYLGNEKGPASLQAWLLAQQNPVPVSPEVLKEQARERHTRIQKVLNWKGKE